MNYFKNLPLLGAAILNACVSSGPAVVKGYANEPLYGRFSGEDWTYRYAYFDPTAETPGDEDYLLIFLPFKPKERCPKGGLDSEAKVVMTAIPLRKKTTKLKRGSKRTLTFSSIINGRPKFKQARRGRVELTLLGRRRVAGRLFGRLDDNNWVSGRFEAIRCSFSDMQEPETPW